MCVVVQWTEGPWERIIYIHAYMRGHVSKQANLLPALSFNMHEYCSLPSQRKDPQPTQDARNGFRLFTTAGKEPWADGWDGDELTDKTPPPQVPHICHHASGNA